MKTLFIGDIVGEPGRRAVKELLPKLQQAESIDFATANILSKIMPDIRKLRKSNTNRRAGNQSQ